MIEKPKIIFIGTPRVGSGSIWTTLVHYGNVQKEQILVNIAGERNRPASEVKGFVGEEAWENSFKFAFVRHPIERFISALATIPDMKAGGVERLGIAMDFNPTIFRPMCEYIDVELDFIGRHERMDEDWDKLRKIVDRDFPDLMHVNKAPFTEPFPLQKPTLNEDQEQFVRDYYAKDFEQFGYE